MTSFPVTKPRKLVVYSFYYILSKAILIVAQNKNVFYTQYQCNFFIS